MSVRKFVGAMVCMSALTASADVLSVKERPVVDGNLDDACWQAARWEGNFKPLAINSYQLCNQTEFAVVTDGEKLYVGVKCHSTDMDKVCARTNVSVFAANTAEIFLSPAADPLKYYQFVITAPEGKSMSDYGEEGGNIHPDPYDPEWRSAVSLGKDAWYGEVEIPLSAFYNTRAEDWRGEWTMNVARMDWSTTVRLHEFSAWSALERGFLEPSNFNRLSGFPKLKTVDDIALTKAVATIRREEGGRLFGDLAVTAYAGKGGVFRFESDYAESGDIELPGGYTTFVRPCSFPSNRRYPVKLALVRKADGRRFARRYPVSVDFDALRVKFTSPEYRANFYPGQDATRIAGVVSSVGAEPVKLVLEGPGIPKTEQTVRDGDSFVFETPGFAKGAATLTLTCGKEKRVKKIRNLEKSPRWMTWVSGGNLVVNGRPTFRRCMYGETYMCSKPFLKRFANEDFGLTPEAQYLGLEPARLIKGSEQKGGFVHKCGSRIAA